MDKPTYQHIRLFGSLGYAHNHSRTSDKLDVLAHKCIFLGHPHGQKGWKVYDLKTKQMYVSRDVVFYKHIFYGLRDKIHMNLQVMRMIFPINFWSTMIHHLMLSTNQPPKLGQQTPPMNLSLLHRPTKMRRLHKTL